MENRGILFDKDGTCIRFDTLWQAVCKLVLKH